MLKKFNYNLNHSSVGKMWGLTLSMLVAIGLNSILPGETLISKNEFTIMLLGLSAVINLGVSTYILLKGDIQPVNVTYVCPTARQYMDQREIDKIEKV